MKPERLIKDLGFFRRKEYRDEKKREVYRGRIIKVVRKLKKVEN